MPDMPKYSSFQFFDVTVGSLGSFYLSGAIGPTFLPRLDFPKNCENAVFPYNVSSVGGIPAKQH
ncbi:hypothetical protein ABU162_18575 [Paenibacillus thiaminolyticus]|uniref:hypothetical protein n=1 Tax=Paenibacillus thiaminolyticus TaxID=49283 RepID=UPI0035A6F3D1